MNGGAFRDLENTGAASGGGEFGQWVALAGIVGATFQGEVLVEPLGIMSDDIFVGGRGSGVVRSGRGVREELVFGRVVIVIVVKVRWLRDVVKAVLADSGKTFLGGVGPELLAVGVDLKLGWWDGAQGGEGLSIVVVVLDVMFVHIILKWGVIY